MPYIAHTPEALLPRSDSKNPNATCRGLTSSGRLCRRAVTGSPRSANAKSPSSSPNSSLREEKVEGYCWQHKEQASQSASATPRSLPNREIRERTSVDTLVDRLGLLEVAEQDTPSRPPRASVQGRGDNREHPSQSQRQEKQARPIRSKPRSKSNLTLFCCIGEVEDVPIAPRPVPKIQSRRERPPIHTASPNLVTRKPAHNDRLSPFASPSQHERRRPSLHHDPSSRTAEFLSLIPKSITPETASLLLAELAKPVSDFDEEGYIYIFWLTSTEIPAAPPLEAVSSLLSVPGRPQPSRSTSDVLKTFSTRSPSIHEDKKILLKIGRASNVQRRLNEWTRQCGYNLSLIRYYPYHPSTPREEEPPRTPRKVPHAHRVERLIHIELQGRRAQGSGRCGACGREHREWFEVEAKRDGVKAVDEVVRRWVDWAIGSGSR